MTSSVPPLTWRNDLQGSKWNEHLAKLGSHPLQSSLWGDARSTVDGIANERWAAFAGDRPIFMARFEVRRIGRFGKIAWMPKGPAWADEAVGDAAFDDLLRRLKRRGFLVCVTDRYREPGASVSGGVPLLPNFPKTALIDLRVGREKLLAAIDSKTRYGIRAAEKAKVTVEQSRSEADVKAFYGLCHRLSRDKNFSLPGSEPLFLALCAAPPSEHAEARLFVARADGQLAAGALVLRCGRSLHYFWGAMDRAFVNQHPSEAIQWTVIQWAAENSLERYDLEGINRADNPGTAQFKLKLGATEVALEGRQAYPLGVMGRLALRAGLWLGKI